MYTATHFISFHANPRGPSRIATNTIQTQFLHSLYNYIKLHSSTNIQTYLKVSGAKLSVVIYLYLCLQVTQSV